MTTTIEKELRRIFEGFEYEEARHARSVEVPADSETPVQQEPSFADTISKRIADMQSTIEDLQLAIDKEQVSIRNGNIGMAAGSEKIKSWQNRLTTMQYKSKMLQTALDTYMKDQSEDNELNLRIVAAKSR